jgi:hypothetical protein
MFCRYCGKEILDEAVLCPHCGVMVKNVDFSALQGQAKVQQPQALQEQTEVKKVDNACTDELKTTSLTRIFGIISTVFIGLSLAIVLSGLFSYLYYFEGYSSSQYNTELYDATAAALLFGFVALGTGITTFVLGLKQKNVGVRYVSTVIFIASIFAVFIPLVCS